MPESPDAPPGVIFTNLHWRYTGVTAANRRVASGVAAKMKAVWLGRHRPEGVAELSWGGLWRLRGELRRSGRWCVWHARRNDEMAVGILLRALGWRLRLVCVSAAQREHSGFTHALYRRMDAIVATSEIARQRVGGKATVIPHGVETQVFQPPTDRAEARRALGVPGKRAIGCFGRVRAQKGTDVFVEAMCRVLRAQPDWTAVIVGAVTPSHESFVAELKQTIAAAGLEGRVLFFGERPEEELPRWFQAVEVYAFCSRIEGFGLTLLEAMASGCAVVASRAGAAEQLIEDGKNGVLVAPGKVEELVGAVAPLLADAAMIEELGRRGREAAVAEHSLAGEVDRLAAEYRRVIG